MAAYLVESKVECPDEKSKLHQFGSFAPVREGANEAKWFVDGQDYMQGVVTYMSPAEAFATAIKFFDRQKVCLIA